MTALKRGVRYRVGVGELPVNLMPAAAILAAVTALSYGCGQEGDSKEPCPSPAPAFRVSISAGAALIPRASRITVTYGAGTETHRLSEEIDGPAVFCEWLSDTTTSAPETIATDGGATVDDLPELTCDLWTSGPAEIEIVAPGFVTVKQELRPERDACGILTREVEVALERPETFDT